MGMILDGIATSEHLDSSGELLRLKNHDISDFNEGRGVLNWEHQNGSEDIIGHITYAHKIFKKDDCEDERQVKFWESCKKPFLYIRAELFEDEEHPGAVACAAMVRYYHKRKIPVLAGFSIEGSTLERDGNELTRTVGRRVALTLRPCNKTAISDVYDDPKTSKEVKKYLNQDMPITKPVYEVDNIIFKDEKTSSDPVSDLRKSLRALQKTLTAGDYNVAPSQLSGGAALQVGLHPDTKKKIKQALSTWDGKKPLRAAIKAALPEVSDNYVDHFTELAQELTLKKSVKFERIGSNHSKNPDAYPEQKQLVEGILIDKEMPNFKDGMGNNKNYKSKNDAGSTVLVKPDQHSDPNHHSAKKATHYYELARDFFGLKDHVPVTNYIKHHALVSNNGKASEVIEHHDGPDGFSEKIFDHIKSAKDSKALPKLTFMDYILGYNDRHWGNFIGSESKNKLMHIDNDKAFDYKGSFIPPSYFMEIEKDVPDMDVQKWVSKLDPKLLGMQMQAKGYSKDDVLAALSRLSKVKQGARSGSTIADILKSDSVKDIK